MSVTARFPRRPVSGRPASRLSALLRSAAGRLAVALIALPLAALPALAQDLSPPADGGKDDPLLPGGASATQETYGDWVVGCSGAKPGKRCALSQMQVNKENRQRVFAVQLSVPAPNSADGVAVLPFGLDVARGVTLTLDDGKPGEPVAFRTCVPVGCLVPLSFDTAFVGKLMQAQTLKINAYAVEGVKADSARPVSFTVSLTGFGRALSRTTALSR